MIKLSALILAFGWLALIAIYATGNLVWDNRLLWAAPMSFGCAATMASVTTVEDSDARALSFLVAIVGFASLLVFAVGCFFLFGLVGKG
ncbi:MAG: hypothetical protein IAG10_09580 [Planctomycetaceae bacterium]|nr:hypothetical protein [Planctomycetaceae bacterium]